MSVDSVISVLGTRKEGATGFEWRVGQGSASYPFSAPEMRSLESSRVYSSYSSVTAAAQRLNGQDPAEYGVLTHKVEATFDQVRQAVPPLREQFELRDLTAPVKLGEQSSFIETFNQGLAEHGIAPIETARVSAPPATEGGSPLLSLDDLHGFYRDAWIEDPANTVFRSGLATDMAENALGDSAASGLTEDVLKDVAEGLFLR